MKRPLASTLAFIIILLSPGAPAYQAFAQTVGKIGVSAGSTGGAALPINSGVNNGGLEAPLAMPVQSIGLDSGLNAALSPAPAAIVKMSVPALQLGAKTVGHPGGLSAAAGQTEALAKQAEHVLEGVKNGDAASALDGVYENGVERRELDAVEGRSDAPSRSGLKGSAPVAGPQATAEVPAVSAPAAKAGPWRRARSFFDLSEFNKSEKFYILGQAVFLLAISVYLASLPLLVKALTGDAAMTGVARMVHYWVFGGASLFAGAVVGKSPMKRILVGAAGGRAMLFGSIGALALFGGLPWAGFLALVGVNALLVAHSHLVDIDTGGAGKIFRGADQKGTDRKIEKAGYVYDFLYYGMMLVVPALIGLPMDWLDGRYGAGIGAAAGFSLFAALMGAVSYIYATRVVTIGDLAAAPRARINGFFSRAAASIKTFGRILVDVPRRNWATARIILGNKAILARSSMSTMENFVEDALFAVVLPTFALDILKVGAFGNGLLLSALTGGGLVASLFLMKRVQGLQKKHGTYKVLAGLTVLAALAFVPSIGLWLAPSLALAIPAVFLMKLMLQPLRSRMRALLQTEIRNDPKAAPHADDIYGLMSLAEMLAAGAGGLAFAWLFHHSLPGTALALALGALAPMKIITLALFAMGFVYLGGLRWVKQQLGRPRQSVHRSPEGNEAKMLERLSLSLKENGLPDYKTAAVGGPASADLPTVVVLAPSSRHKIALAREGGRQSPANFHLVLDSSWLIQETGPDGRTKLLVEKGVTFDAIGQATVVTYEIPRRAHYFANYFTLGSNDRDDGDVFEKNLDVPQSSSLRLEKLVNDKLGTRLMLAAKGIAVPATLALLMPLHPLAARSMGAQGGVQVAAMPAAESREAGIADLVDEYLSTFKGGELVVKPSGPQFHSGRGVKFFKRSERDAIVAHALSLAVDPQMTEDGAVLLDERVDSASLNRDGRKMETAARVLAARTPWDGAVTTGMFARVGPWGKPTTAEAADPRDNALVEPMERLFKEWQASGQLDELGARELEAKMRRIGSDAMVAIAESEKSLERRDGEPYQAQTDMIGLDVMIERRGGKLVPVVIEVNDHDAGGQIWLDQMYPGRAGEHSREWVATMLQRARRDALKGKRLLLVGAGYAGKRAIFARAKELGVKVVLASPRSEFVDGLVKDGLVDEYIEVDNSRVTEARAVIREKLRRSARKNGRLDGLTTFWEDDVELTALIAEDLKLPYHSPKAARSARSKFETQRMSKERGVPAARHEIVDNLSTAHDDAKRVDLIARFRKAAEQVSFPAVLKPVSGAGAVGTERVNSAEEAVTAYERISALISPKNDPIFTLNSDLLLMQYLDGKEYDVDLVLADGAPVFESIADNKPTREPSFLATGSRLPSTLTAKQQRESIDQAIAAARALGLKDGVLHMEGKYTSEGARLIEANARMGGAYVHEWVKTVWGVDLVEEGLMAAAGVAGRPFKPEAPLVHLDGDFFNSDKPGTLKAVVISDEVRAMPGFVRFRPAKRIGDRITLEENGGYARIGMIEASGENAQEARRNLEAIKAKIRVIVE